MTSSQKKLFGLTIILAVVSIFLVLVITACFSIYTRRSDDRLARFFSPMVPIARVGSSYITYNEFLFQRDTLKKYLLSDAAKSVGFAQPINATLEKNVMDRIVHERIIQQLAAERHVTVGSDEVNKMFEGMMASTSSTKEDVQGYLTSTYQWTEEQFKANILKPLLLEEQVGMTYASDTAAAQEALQTAVSATQGQVKLYLRFDE